MSRPYTLIRAARSTVSLQVKRGGEVVVRAPYLYPKYLIDRFVTTKEHWLAKRLAEQTSSKAEPVRQRSDEELKSLITAFLTHYSHVMGLSPRAVRYKIVRTYWGSCSPKGILTFNLKLAYVSSSAVEYVVVHELSHLKYRGHGVRFWDLVQRNFPKTNEMRRLLRHHMHATSY